MKIKEVLELTEKMTIAQIAKEFLAIGEKPARKALKEAGCYSIVGQKGWFFEDEEHPEVLEKSIYDFHKTSEDSKTQEIREGGSVTKRHSFDLSSALVKKMKLHCIREDIPLYAGVEKAISHYLADAEKNHGYKVKLASEHPTPWEEDEE